LPSAARVRPASAAAHNSPSVRCTPLAYANDLTPCRMALHFDYASAAAPTSSKRPAPTATRGSSYTAPLALRFLYSFSAVVDVSGAFSSASCATMRCFSTVDACLGLST
jgi:hypothetical protein